MKKLFVKWIIGMNQPELLSAYDDQTLNAFIAKGGKLVPPVMKRDWWDDAWSSIGETWDDISDGVSDWWNDGGGKDVVTTDADDAVAGAIGGAIAGNAAGGIGAGPGAIAGGIGAGCIGSISEAIKNWLEN